MNFKNYIFILLIFILILPNIHSEVADLSFSIDNDGLVTVSGVTDYPSVLLPNDTYAYTTKNSQYWAFDINYPVFNKFYFSVVLPKDYKINAIITSNKYLISSNNDRITVTGFGINESLNIKINYFKDQTTNTSFNFWLYFSGILLLLLVSIYFWLFLKKPKQKDKPNLTYKNINQRQKNILNILIKEKTVSQNKLLKILNIPKSSLSRNISSLESKGYIERKKSGLTYILKIKD
jgi:uncharacterized membrane protein